jgi:hypothetical protein
MIASASATSLLTRNRYATNTRMDERGNTVSTRSQSALDHTETAMWRMVSYHGNPVDDLDRAIEADPNWVMPLLMKADVLLSTSEHAYGQMADACLLQAASLAADGRVNDRERQHLVAAQLCAAGHWQHACEAWNRVLVDHPQDLLALLCAHIFDFYRGDARNHQRRVSRVLPEWSADAPLYSFVLGMHAFGLEECNLYPQAHAAGLAALELEPRDPWAVHAVTHVHEMRGEYEEGAAWLMGRADDWVLATGFAFHNWWHLALFQLESLDTDAALALFDQRIGPAPELALQRVDVTALLWRLKLLGVDVGSRWEAIANQWPHDAPEAGHYAFNDAHAVMALIGAGRINDASALVEAVRRKAADDTSLGMMAAEVGLALIRGLLAYGRGQYGDAVAWMSSVRDHCHRFGGSHAQRDVVDQTLLDAALRGGQHHLARHLLNERMVSKARSPLTAHWAARVH